MKFIYRYILLIIAIALCSCSRNEAHEAVVDDVDVPISLACSLQPVTRAYTATQGVQIADGRTISVWCDEHADKTDATNHAGDAVDYVKGWQLTVNSGALSGTNTYYYPKPLDSRIDIYALHGNFNNTITEGTTTWDAFNTALTHTVETDQSATGNLENSDLLYSVNHNVVKSKNAQTLTFKHLMSKIEIYLLSGSGISQADLQDANVKVEILNTMLTAGITLSKTAATSSTVTASGTIDATTLNAINARKQTDNTATVDIPDPSNPGNTMPVNAYTFAEAIIVPQKFDTNRDGTGTGMELIRITMADNSVRNTSPATFDFQPGKRYVFYVTVNIGGLEITGQITNWADGTTSDVVAM